MRSMRLTVQRFGPSVRAVRKFWVFEESVGHAQLFCGGSLQVPHSGML